ncbi:hypothetical protein SPRG_11151 [Saprolegnia parasitica CBS 223.65]|uniref:WW domain-containing protein n=1 Tax=Saprolegnia parasitica (strain CBS 223.65) TaxID=695850 RepID=A0A067BXJ3_SAPPC|nr:hypothetical protein SPRG_11151 [Saprolegnia parasitica CBS 223.65]KDO23219.1 hypothetical protein SPRG_11151 [Saprolegnia parasitica CBS 223.65]|eukprot:XP_012206017.1 hypothetical protein SPRG_11151 [Saprolegnia parasitica CBS 223.65]
MASISDRFVKCPACHVNIPKQDLAMGEAPACTVCHAPLPATLFAEAASAAPAKPATQRRWVALTSRRGKTYYHNNETGEDRWDKPSDFETTVSVHEALPAFVPFKNDDPVRNAIMLQQSKQEAKKHGIPESVVDALAKQHHTDAPSLNSTIAAMQKQAAKAAPVRAKEAAPTPTPPAHKNPMPAPASLDATSSSSSSSCCLM